METEFVRLADAAGEAIMRLFGSAECASGYKDDGSLVTEADEAADRIIREGLEESFAGTPIVSEECPESHRSEARDFLIVDPLDGTSGFSRGSPEFTVNIAYVEDGRPTFGVVFAPALGRMFCSAADGGIRERTGSGPDAVWRRIERRREPRPGGPLKVVASKTERHGGWLEGFLRDFRVAGIEYTSSSLKFCLLACGEADLYPRSGPTMEWDTAAGHAVLSSAGGRVVLLDGRTPLSCGKPGYWNPGFVAFGPGVGRDEA